jgi:hypothetical protein
MLIDVGVLKTVPEFLRLLKKPFFERNRRTQKYVLVVAQV